MEIPARSSGSQSWLHTGITWGATKTNDAWVQLPEIWTQLVWGAPRYQEFLKLPRSFKCAPEVENHSIRSSPWTRVSPLGFDYKLLWLSNLFLDPNNLT